MEDAPLQAALEKLADADILLVQGMPPDSDYRFKHALIQDAAYENLLKSRRQVLHRRVAEILRDRFADTAAAEPEVLGASLHPGRPDRGRDRMVGQGRRPGAAPLRLSGAIAHLGKAIEMADKAESRRRAGGSDGQWLDEPPAEAANQLWPGAAVVKGLCR